MLCRLIKPIARIGNGGFGTAFLEIVSGYATWPKYSSKADHNGPDHEPEQGS